LIFASSLAAIIWFQTGYRNYNRERDSIFCVADQFADSLDLFGVLAIQICHC